MDTHATGDSGTLATVGNQRVRDITPSSDPPPGSTEDEGRNAVEGSEQFDSPELERQLEDAARLLAYAAEVAIDIPKEHRQAVLIAKASRRWTPDLAAKFLAAMTEIARATRPVCARSLRACVSGEARAETRHFYRWMWNLAPVIVLFSIADFYTSKLCEQIQADLSTAQTLAVKLNDTLFYESEYDEKRVPVKHYTFNQAEVIADLTQFAILTRSIHTNSIKLNRFTVPKSSDPFPNQRDLELDPELPTLSGQSVEAIRRYQGVRHFAQNVRSDATLLYGALLQCALPMMYAILGTLAYLLRKFELQLSDRTFSESGRHTARFATAAIGGIVVGLFNLDIAPLNNVAASHSASVSPLAIAFMVGYAVDMFFNFVETLVGSFTRAGAAAVTQPRSR